MSITTLFNQPHVLWQTPDGEYDLANDPLAVHVDNCGTICIEQQGNTVCLNKATIPELCNLLKQLSSIR